MSRRPLATGCCVFGSVIALVGSLVAPSPSVNLNGVPGAAMYRPICEYVRPEVAPNVWIRMYLAKQRAWLPLSTAWFATEQLGVWIGDGVTFMPCALYCANSLFCAACAALTSPAIAVGVMSGVPVICSFLRLELTVDLPLKPITIAAMPN